MLFQYQFSYNFPFLFIILHSCRFSFNFSMRFLISHLDFPSFGCFVVAVFLLTFLYSLFVLFIHNAPWFLFFFYIFLVIIIIFRFNKNLLIFCWVVCFWGRYIHRSKNMTKKKQNNNNTANKITIHGKVKKTNTQSSRHI